MKESWNHPTVRRSGGLGWSIGWLLLYCANLILPLMMGWDVTARHGRAGMVVAVIMIGGAGYAASRASRRAGISLVMGGVLGLGSLLIGLPIIAGLFALNVTEFLGTVDPIRDGPLPRTNGELGGFVATIVTALLVLCPTWLIGAVFTLCFIGDVAPPKSEDLYFYE